MKDILILVPTKYEDIELTGIADVFDRRGITYDFVSINNKDNEYGSHFVSIKTKHLSQIKSDEYKGLFLPGGPGASSYIQNDYVVNIINKYAQNKKWMLAICAAPETFLKLGLLENIKYTAHPDFAHSKNKINRNVVIDKNYITGKNYMIALELGHVIADELDKQK